MYNLPASTSQSSEVKSFKELWKRPGGGFAKVTGYLAIAALLFGLYKALPFLIALATNTLTLILLLLAIAAILFLVTNKEFRRAVKLTWLQVMRKIYGLVVNIDPINILKNGIREMDGKRKLINENITKLDALLVGMKRKKNEYQKEFEQNVGQRKELEKLIAKQDPYSDTVMKYKAKLQLTNNKIARDNDMLKAQSERIITTEKYLDILKKLQIVVNFKVEDANNQLRYLSDEYEQAKATSKAINSISSILKGEITKSMEEEMAMEEIAKTVNTSIAEVNRLLDGSNDILVNAEIEGSINSGKADKILAEFDKKGFAIFDAPVNDVALGMANSGTEQPVYVISKPNENTNEKTYF